MVSIDKIPRDLSKWHKARIVEDIGSPEEHADDFYRLGLLGLEQDRDGTWELYIVVGNEPIKVKGDFQTHEEALMFFEGSIARKEVVEPDEVCEQPEVEIEVEAEIEPGSMSIRDMLADWVSKSGDKTGMTCVSDIYMGNTNGAVPMGQGTKADVLSATESNHDPGQPRVVMKAADAYGNTPISQMVMATRGDIAFAKADDVENKPEDEPEDEPDGKPKDAEADAPDIPEESEPAPEAEAEGKADLTLAGNIIGQTMSAALGSSHVAPLPTVDQGLDNKGRPSSRGTGLEGAPGFRDMLTKAYIEKAEEQGYRTDGSIFGDIVIRDMWRRVTLGTDKDLPMSEKMPEPEGTDRV